MAKKTLTSNKKGTDPEDKLPWKLGKQYKILLGFILILLSVAQLKKNCHYSLPTKMSM